MGLVDYGSSSEEESEKEEYEEEKRKKEEKEDAVKEGLGQGRRQNPNSLPSRSSGSSSSTLQQDQKPPMTLKLPDVSLLLDSPSFPSDHTNDSDHSSKVAASIGARELKKREANGSLPSLIQRKVPRGNFPAQRIQPDTLGGLLMPPQISGRSNVVTEDIGKLFVRRRHEDTDSDGFRKQLDLFDNQILVHEDQRIFGSEIVHPAG